MVNWFNKDGSNTKRAFRVHCNHRGCKRYIIGRWGGGYGGITTKDGEFDSRNKCYVCPVHSTQTKLKLLVDHIRNVQNNAYRLAMHLLKQGKHKLARDLVGAAMNHDNSKFRDKEWDDLWDFVHHPLDQEFRDAIQHHWKLNDHHPEHWFDGDIDVMPDYCIAVMVCDWHARCKENDGNFKEFISLDNILKRWRISKPKFKKIQEYAAILEG